MNTKIMKKFITFVLIFSFVFSPVLTTQVSAQLTVPVTDPITNAGEIYATSKEGGWDALAWMVVNLIIERMAKDTVNWINKGFKGSPAFITNPEAYYKGMGDKIAGQYIFGNPNLNFLCGPISAKVKLALSKNYIGDTQWNCSLTQVGKNMDDFMGDFEKGGWDSFFEISQNQHMNPVGAYLQAENELNIQIANKNKNLSDDLNRGSGFLSYKKCKRYAGSIQPKAGNNADTGRNDKICVKRAPLDNTPNSGKCLEEKEVTTDSNGNQINTDDIGPGAEGACLEYETETPGSVISEQLNKTLGLGGDKLAVADELNEIVSALLNQLVSKAIGSVAGGLRSLSKPDSTNNGRTFTDQLTTKNPGDPSAGYSGYFGCDPNDPSVFCDKPNTDVLKIPIPETLPEQAGDTGNSTSVRPADKDCDISVATNYASLVSMAQTYASLSGITPEQAMLNIDCDPQGIH